MYVIRICSVMESETQYLKSRDSFSNTHRCNEFRIWLIVSDFYRCRVSLLRDTFFKIIYIVIEVYFNASELTACCLDLVMIGISSIRLSF